MHDVLNLCQCSHRLYSAATHPLIFQHGIDAKLDTWNGVQLIGLSATFKTKSKLQGAMKSRVGRQLGIVDIMMADSPKAAFLSPLLDALAHAHSLRALTLELPYVWCSVPRWETAEMKQTWLRQLDYWTRRVMNKYDGRIPLDRIMWRRACGGGG